ncbi:DUF599 domain-containing protein [Roseateles sp. BYS180W]|uniref:DUF599 domain-containing protein n=1 Tax=Roseateles rivi TaxID=3299028 RepID=A0ABW7FV79_9BURK
MMGLLKHLDVFPPADWLAIVVFLCGWVGYAIFAKRHAEQRASLLALTNRIRRQWMYQLTFRDTRVLDGAIAQNLNSSPSFFASTTILIIGGLLAALSTGEQARAVVRDLPFTVNTSILVFELKLVLLTAIFVYAFFRFTWSMRQYSFGALLIASVPEATQFLEEKLSREDFADRAGTVVGLAAESFNDGLRAYYLAFAVVAWFFSPWAFMAGTLGVIYILYQREFNSDVLVALRAAQR